MLGLRRENRIQHLRLCQVVLGVTLACLVLLVYIEQTGIIGYSKILERLNTRTSSASLDQHAEIWWRKVLCGESVQQTSEDTHDPIILQQLYRDIKPKMNDKNAFLVETSCNSHPPFRAWCSVESWAQQNPNLTVWYVLTSETADNTDGLPRRLLQEYHNLQVVGAHLDSLFGATPAKEFFQSGNWTLNMNWIAPVLSDMMRTALVWLWGGFYSDTDMMCLRKMTNFTNSFGYESGRVVNSAFFTMKSNSTFLRQILEALSSSYNTKWWGSIGPSLYTKMMRKECALVNIIMKDQTPPVTCRNITVYPPQQFYPLLYSKIPQFFAVGTGKNLSEKFSGSSLVHFWNQLSQDSVVRVKSDSIYEVAAKTYCPITYTYAFRRSKFF